ncbi:MAG: single-stranded-DNA-specific exonuclease RecJ [Thermoleophilia bacterium]|nr:single-stranded-DNA-specific exonuclease RecJ [Thermoleophilia bacterium]
MLPPASFQLAPCDPNLVDELRRDLGCTETLAWMLARRGITPDTARLLIEDDADADEARLHDPLLLGDMAAGVERIRYAIEQGEQIVVHGDYDADGVCSTTLLVEGLEAVGATDVSAFLPDRFTNGYGLQIDQVERFARAGAKLLIAVDCGITAVEAVAHANDLGLDVIICDHHRPGDVLPDAILCSSRPGNYPFPDICATVVAGKLIQALGGPSGPRQHELEAIATIADCMPLVDENRALVRRGLRALRTTDRPGLVALINQCGLRAREIDAEAIGFKLAPRLNAVGRISQSERAYELLRATTEHAPALAAAVDATNEDRRAIERDISALAIAQVEGWSAQERDARIYVVHGSGWHEGVVGIVASRLVEKYWRPVIVISDSDPARGSGRSVDGVDLHAALATCDDLLLRWGGHAQAAGVTIDPTRIDELRTRLAAWGAAHIPDELLSPRDRIDAIVPAHDLRFELVQELNRLAPWGTGWERPTLLAIDATVEETRAIGGDGTHLKCVVCVGDNRVSGIGFGMANLIPGLAGGTRVDVAVRPSINRFRGAESLQVELVRVYPVAPEVDEQLPTRTVQLPLELVLASATGLVPPEIGGGDPDALPGLEPMLARATTVDLRHRTDGVSHVAQLLAGGARVAVAVADVPRRRELFLGFTTDRLGVVDYVEASEHVAPLELRARLHRHAEEPGAQLVLTDHASLHHVLAADSPLALDAVIVFDPPAVAAHRDLLARATAPLHLVFGAAEQRFSSDTLRAALDVRGTLADTYRTLRDNGPLAGDPLRRALFGTAEYERSPSAIVHGLQTLIGRGLLELDATGQLALGAAAPKPTSPVV